VAAVGVAEVSCSSRSACEVMSVTGDVAAEVNELEQPKLRLCPLPLPHLPLPLLLPLPLPHLASSPWPWRPPSSCELLGWLVPGSGRSWQVRLRESTDLPWQLPVDASCAGSLLVRPFCYMRRVYLWWFLSKTLNNCHSDSAHTRAPLATVFKANRVRRRCSSTETA
jgi:hypothetical protein